MVAGLDVTVREMTLNGKRLAIGSDQVARVCDVSDPSQPEVVDEFPRRPRMGDGTDCNDKVLTCPSWLLIRRSEFITHCIKRTNENSLEVGRPLQEDSGVV